MARGEPLGDAFLEFCPSGFWRIKPEYEVVVAVAMGNLARSGHRFIGPDGVDYTGQVLEGTEELFHGAPQPSREPG